MEEIKNYTLKEFLQQPPELIEEYSKLLKNLEPIETKNKIYELTLGEVEEIKQNFGNEDALPHIYKYMHGLSEDEFLKLKVTEFYALLNSITKQLENLLAMEERELTPKHHDTKWEMVEGSKRLGKLGILPTVDSLAGGDILKFQQVLDLKYITVFNKLRLDRIKADIQTDMDKIKTKNDSV
ncbi:hypothetical protein [Zunongwangia atlantica]|uniref:Uncharacterized protein n=1 Tax=Zunongwangia atlantica 22II14-10F7 TaxID=1185767 RepID=A0A1Y1T2Y2_9FLAO|nr:hypothetical protein [Zunongwangia atlantica]ORL45388.1 hypothetical protein IIF7_11218 [Zunongwangia atlantica 22II14-10F7]